MRIRDAQKHTGPSDPDPQHWSVEIGSVSSTTLRSDTYKLISVLFVKELLESVEIGGVSSTSLRSYNTELVSKLINLVSAACQVLLKVFSSFDSLFKGFFMRICQSGTVLYSSILLHLQAFEIPKYRIKCTCSVSTVQ
jgi:hypothetical protein